MFGKSNQQKYADYIKWFEEKVADPNNWGWMRADKDCENYQMTSGPDGTPSDPGTPRPYSYNEACIRFMDPKVWSVALGKNRAKQRAFVQEQFKYVGGNSANGLLNPEYIKNEEKRIAYNKELHKSYSVHHEVTPRELEAVAMKNPQVQGAVQPDYKPPEPSFLERIASAFGITVAAAKARLDGDVKGGEREGIETRYKV